MDVPEKWRAYNCEDYFLSPLSQTGWWDPDGECWYIEPAERLHKLFRQLLRHDLYPPRFTRPSDSRHRAFHPPSPASVGAKVSSCVKPSA